MMVHRRWKASKRKTDATKALRRPSISLNQGNLSPNFSPELRVELCDFSLASPTMVASGVLGISFDLFPRIISSGCGAVVTKSIGIEPRDGYTNPTMTGVESGYLNAIGLANPGADVFAKELEEGLKDTPLVMSIFADTPERFGQLALKFDRFNFLAYELNLSCPHVKDVGSEIGSDPNEAASVVRCVKLATKKPVLAKMPASLPNVGNWARKVEQAGADAIVAINAVRAMKIDIESRKPVLSNKIGGLSGSAMKPIGVRYVYELFEAVKLPVIGVGGVSNWQDAVEYFLAGARCVQVGSAMAGDFLNTFGEINKGVTEYLRKNHFSDMKELVGYGHN